MAAASSRWQRMAAACFVLAALAMWAAPAACGARAVPRGAGAGVAAQRANASSSSSAAADDVNHGVHERYKYVSSLTLYEHGYMHADPTVVRGTLFLPSTGGDRRVRLFLHEHDPSPSPDENHQAILVLDLPPGLSGADIAAAGRVVLECQRQWNNGGGALLESAKWLVYCNGRRVGFAARRGEASDAEGWVLEKLWAVTAGAGRLPGGAGVEYMRGRFERTVASSDAESFHLVDPIGWLGFNGNDGLSIFFHRI
ncbi:hypothetical protein OsJ_12465 [Oryza sativa Japonica Group]|uniref:Uncharacterized protein n=1 Tax=Oryza sativa subsp. japonica TaxID=39947 RepID=B9FBD3_ORYSJ|nr:hypothetical protein OsJ_12465 [Oryza sativa Japonica Group]